MQTTTGIQSSTASIILRPFINMHVVGTQESTENYVCNREYSVKGEKISGQAKKMIK